MFKRDLEMARPKLQEHFVATKASKKKSFYHNLHISPIMVGFKVVKDANPIF
jgi:hypothetical protein